MLDRRMLVCTLRLVAFLMLLVQTQVASVRLSESDSDLTRPDSCFASLVAPANHYLRVLTDSTSSQAGYQDTDQASEDEEQDQVDAIHERRLPVPSFRVYRNNYARQLCVPQAPPSYYPLRC